MNSVRALKIAASQIAFLSGALISSQAMSQTLEEIIVTSQKRAESIQDVPISVYAMTGETISDTGMQRLADAIDYVPNVTISATEIGDSINIRGIQSGNQAGFEQSVATFVDGVYRGRSVQSRFAFLDVERLEVLRGPQGILFGKNVIAGALNITSASPTEEFEGSVQVAHNPEFDETEISGYLSGPLSDTVRARLAVMSRTLDDGWVNNARYDQGEPQVDEQAFRLSLDWDISDVTSASFKHEQGEWDNFGVPWEHSQLGPLAVLAPLGVESDIDMVTQVGTFPLAPDPNQELGSGQLFEGDTTETALTIKHLLDSGSEITGIASFSGYDFTRLVDADVSILDTLNFNDEEDLEQTALELRIASDQDGDFEYIAGLFYQDADLVAEGNTPLGLTGIDGAVNGGCLAAGGVIGDYTIGVDDALAAAGAAAAANAALGTSAAVGNACGLATLTGPLLAAGVDGLNRYVELDQNTESWAGFGQVTWNLSDTLRTTVGLRYTEEEKTASHQAIVANYGLNDKTPSANPLVGALAVLLGEYTPHDFDGLSRNEESLTWSLNFQWDATDNMMTYATASTGFKAGGFNSFYLSTTPNNEDIEFEDEEVLTFEIGSKMSLMDGAAELNLAAFRSEYDNMQVSVFSGSTTFNVDNAAQAVTQGIEIDGRWQATNELLISGALGLIDFEFDEFPNQGCTDAQFSGFREGVWDGGANFLAAFLTPADCAAAGINDLAGRTSAQTADVSASLSALYETNISDTLLLGIGLDANYRDDSYRQEDLDPNTLDDASTRINALVRLSSDAGWTLMLNGYNLTDEESFDLGQDIPLASGAHFIQPKRPRSAAVTVRYDF